MSTELNKYEKLESEIVSVFSIKNEDGTFSPSPDFDIAPLPDNEAEYRPQLPRPQVWCAYDSSDFSESDTISQVVQDEKVMFSFEIHSKTRRGAKGTMSIFETIRKKIVGLKLLGYDKMSLVKGTSLAGSGANHWVFYAQFSTNTKVADCQPEAVDNLLKDPDFIYH